jgi:hypothetical protein
MVVGGYAVAFHGYPRYTKDIDIWLDQSADNVQRLLSCLQEFGFGSLNLKSEDFTEGDNVVQLGYPPRRVDLITGIHGMNFKTVYADHVSITIGDVDISYIDLTNLIEAKKIAGRLQDLADIEKLS